MYEVLDNYEYLTIIRCLMKKVVSNGTTMYSHIDRI